MISDPNGTVVSVIGLFFFILAHVGDPNRHIKSVLFLFSKYYIHIFAKNCAVTLLLHDFPPFWRFLPTKFGDEISFLLHVLVVSR